MIRIAQAASSEHGTANGTPPNQLRTGVTAKKPEGNLDGELNVIPFYAYNWVAVYRAKDPAIAEKIADIAYKCVANGSKVGYGQQLSGAESRCGLFDEMFCIPDDDPWKIKRPVNCDCGQLVATAVYNAGVYEPNLRLLNTSKLPDLLMGTGAFIKLTDRELLEAAHGVKRGDIYHKWGHTMIALDTDRTQEMTPGRIENCSACNMREGPSTDYSVIQTLHRGNLINIVSTAANNWKQIEIGGKYGYVSWLYAKELPKAKATGNVWMRKKAGVISSETEIMVIPYGAIVHITGNTEKVGLTTWYDVFYCGKRGWASGKYIATL